MAASTRGTWRAQPLSQKLYYASLSLWMLVSVLNTSLYAEYLPYRPIRLGLLGLATVSELAKGLPTRRSIAALAFAGLVFCANLDSSYSMVDIIVFAAVGRDFDHKRTARLCLAALAVGVVFVVASADLGIIGNNVETGGKRVREFLGFGWMLYPGQYAFAIACLLAYVRSRRFSVADLALCCGIAVYMYGRTLSRLSFMLTVAVAVVTWVVARYARSRGRHASTPRLVRVGGAALVAATAIAALASVGLTALFDSSVGWMARLDEFTVLSGRMRYGQEAVQKYGIPLLGQQIQLVGNGLDETGKHVAVGAYNWVDCMYVRMLVEDGLIVFVAFVGLATMLAWHAWRTRDVGLMIVVAACAAHGMLDDMCFSLVFNPMLLLGGLPFSSDDTVQASFPRLSRLLADDAVRVAGDAARASSPVVSVARRWAVILASASACALCAWGYAKLAPVRYRAESSIAVSKSVIITEGIARYITAATDTADTWLHAGSNVTAGSVFVTAQGYDAMLCQTLANRLLELTDLYVHKNEATSKVTSSLRPVENIETLSLDARALAVAAGGVGFCGSTMCVAATAGRTRLTRKEATN